MEVDSMMEDEEDWGEDIDFTNLEVILVIIFLSLSVFQSLYLPFYLSLFLFHP